MLYPNLGLWGGKLLSVCTPSVVLEYDTGTWIVYADVRSIPAKVFLQKYSCKSWDTKYFLNLMQPYMACSAHQVLD